MVTTVQNWMIDLQHCGAPIGFALLLIGVVLTLGGWRVRKGAVPASFGLVGLLAGVYLFQADGQQWLYPAVGLVVLALSSYLMGERAAALLGGLIGAAIVNYVGERFGLRGATLWALTAIGLAACTALSLIDLRQVIIVITSFEGAVLIAAAGVSFLSSVPWIANQFRGTSGGWSILALFTLLVPTVIGTMLQMADAKQRDCGIIGA